jgi:putative transposase
MDTYNRSSKRAVLRRLLEPKQYLAIRYTERLGDAGVVNSVGSKGDSYDNALAETVNGLYKAELINRQGPWRSVEQVEVETAAWVHWWNAQRLHGACGDIPPAEYEAAYWTDQQEATLAA